MAAGGGAAAGVAAEVDAGGVGGCVPVFLGWRLALEDRMRVRRRGEGEGKDGIEVLIFWLTSVR